MPAAGLTLPGISAVGALMFAVFALFATIASVRGHATVVVLLFLASFFPVGASLIRIDHWLSSVGWLDVGLGASLRRCCGSRVRAASPCPSPPIS